MKMLKAGDVLRSNNYTKTGLKLGREYTVREVFQNERGVGNHYYALADGYAADHIWLESGFISVVRRAPEVKVGDLVRISKSKYTSINDFGKMGIVTQKHWENHGVTMFGVVVQGCGKNNWSYTNNQLEVIE